METEGTRAIVSFRKNNFCWFYGWRPGFDSRQGTMKGFLLFPTASILALSPT